MPGAKAVCADYNPILDRNDGDFQVVDIATAWGLPNTGLSSTYHAAFAAYDNDEYLDLVTDGKIYRNSGGTNHYRKVRVDSDPLYHDFGNGGKLPQPHQVCEPNTSVLLIGTWPAFLSIRQPVVFFGRKRSISN